MPQPCYQGYQLVNGGSMVGQNDTTDVLEQQVESFSDLDQGRVITNGIIAVISRVVVGLESINPLEIVILFYGL